MNLFSITQFQFIIKNNIFIFKLTHKVFFFNDILAIAAAQLPYNTSFQFGMEFLHLSFTFSA